MHTAVGGLSAEERTRAAQDPGGIMDGREPISMDDVFRSEDGVMGCYWEVWSWLMNRRTDSHPPNSVDQTTMAL